MDQGGRRSWVAMIGYDGWNMIDAEINGMYVCYM
jgi:hypothetical protein